MNDVKIIFHGMVFWWLTVPGPYTLIPDLSRDTFAHNATIVAPRAAFVDGECPLQFSSQGDDCFFELNGAGKDGGVKISFTPTASVPPPGEDAFCAIPPVQRTGPYELQPDYTPPSGRKNAAWMSVAGGTPRSGVLVCDQQPPGNCPRFIEWTVPASKTEHVKMTLDNLKSGDPIVKKLAHGARLIIGNSPSVAPAPVATESRPMARNSADDWCFYFAMVKKKGETGTAAGVGCPGPPPIPRPCVSELRLRNSTGVRHHTWLFQTVACSNSTYP